MLINSKGICKMTQNEKQRQELLIKLNALPEQDQQIMALILTPAFTAIPLNAPMSLIVDSLPDNQLQWAAEQIEG